MAQGKKRGGASRMDITAQLVSSLRTYVCLCLCVCVCVSLQPVHVFSNCSKQAMYINVLPLLFTAATPPTQPEGAAQTETNPAAGTYSTCVHVCGVSVCACMYACVCMSACCV